MVCLNLIENMKKIKMFNTTIFNINDIILMILASLIAGLGLLYNSTASILGSMLVSPLTDTIGKSSIYFINNLFSNLGNELSNIGILLIICIFISISIGYLNKEFLIIKTPTAEMLSRITYSHVIIDVALAALSGISLGLAVVNKDVLIKSGVTLILSLTPPLVNFGIFFGEVIYYYFKQRYTNDKKEVELYDKKINKLMNDGNKSFILFLLNLISVYITLIITLYIIC